MYLKYLKLMKNVVRRFELIEVLQFFDASPKQLSLPQKHQLHGKSPDEVIP